MKSRKKPIEIEAVRFTGDNEVELATWTHGRFHLVNVEDRDFDPDVIAEVFDVLHSTWAGVKLGQWIIRGVQGEFYPCDANVFASTYDEVSAPSAALPSGRGAFVTDVTCRLAGAVWDVEVSRIPAWDQCSDIPAVDIPAVNIPADIRAALSAWLDTAEVTA